MPIKLFRLSSCRIRIDGDTRRRSNRTNERESSPNHRFPILDGDACVHFYSCICPYAVGCSPTYKGGFYTYNRPDWRKDGVGKISLFSKISVSLFFFVITLSQTLTHFLGLPVYALFAPKRPSIGNTPWTEIQLRKVILVWMGVCCEFLAKLESNALVVTVTLTNSQHSVSLNGFFKSHNRSSGSSRVIHRTFANTVIAH